MECDKKFLEKNTNFKNDSGLTTNTKSKQRPERKRKVTFGSSTENMENLVITQKVKVKNRKIKCTINFTNFCQSEEKPTEHINTTLEKPIQNPKHMGSVSEDRIVPHCSRKMCKLAIKAKTNRQQQGSNVRSNEYFKESNYYKQNKRTYSNNYEESFKSTKRFKCEVKDISYENISSDESFGLSSYANDKLDKLYVDEKLDTLIMRTKTRERLSEVNDPKPLCTSTPIREAVDDFEDIVSMSSETDVSLHSQETLILEPKLENLSSINLEEHMFASSEQNFDIIKTEPTSDVHQEFLDINAHTPEHFVISINPVLPSIGWDSQVKVEPESLDCQVSLSPKIPAIFEELLAITLENSEDIKTDFGINVNQSLSDNRVVSKNFVICEEPTVDVKSDSGIKVHHDLSVSNEDSAKNSVILEEYAVTCREQDSEDITLNDKKNVNQMTLDKNKPSKSSAICEELIIASGDQNPEDIKADSGIDVNQDSLNLKTVSPTISAVFEGSAVACHKQDSGNIKAFSENEVNLVLPLVVQSLNLINVFSLKLGRFEKAAKENDHQNLDLFNNNLVSPDNSIISVEPVNATREKGFECEISQKALNNDTPKDSAILSEEPTVANLEEYSEEPAVASFEENSEKPAVASFEQNIVEPAVASFEQNIEEPAVAGLQKNSKERAIANLIQNSKEPDMAKLEPNFEQLAVASLNQNSKETIISNLQQNSEQPAVNSLSQKSEEPPEANPQKNSEEPTEGNPPQNSEEPAKANPQQDSEDITTDTKIDVKKESLDSILSFEKSIISGECVKASCKQNYYNSKTNKKPIITRYEPESISTIVTIPQSETNRPKPKIRNTPNVAYSHNLRKTETITTTGSTNNGYSDIWSYPTTSSAIMNLNTQDAPGTNSTYHMYIYNQQYQYSFEENRTNFFHQIGSSTQAAINHYVPAHYMCGHQSNAPANHWCGHQSYAAVAASNPANMMHPENAYARANQWCEHQSYAAVAASNPANMMHPENAYARANQWCEHQSYAAVAASNPANTMHPENAYARANQWCEHQSYAAVAASNPANMMHPENAYARANQWCEHQSYAAVAASNPANMMHPENAYARANQWCEHQSYAAVAASNPANMMHPENAYARANQWCEHQSYAAVAASNPANFTYPKYEHQSYYVPRIINNRGYRTKSNRLTYFKQKQAIRPRTNHMIAKHTYVKLEPNMTRSSVNRWPGQHTTARNGDRVPPARVKLEPNKAPSFNLLSGRASVKTEPNVITIKKEKLDSYETSQAMFVPNVMNDNLVRFIKKEKD